MAAQTEITRGRIVRLGTAGQADAPTDGPGGTQPTLIMSPWTAVGLRTTGLGMGLKAPGAGAATAAAAGFSIQLYALNPLTWAWFAGAASDKHYGEYWVTYDFNASALYVRLLAAGVAADGDVDLHFWEL